MTSVNGCCNYRYILYAKFSYVIRQWETKKCLAEMESLPNRINKWEYILES